MEVNTKTQKGFRVVKYPDTFRLGEASARFVAEKIKSIVNEKQHVNVIFATGASQFNFINYLVSISSIPWNKVTAFHLDEYVGLPNGENHPASFRKYLKERLFDRLQPSCKAINYVDPDQYDSYETLLKSVEIDLACIGIGENGHIAFNDPPVADFNDPRLVKVVELDEACRMQQVGEGWFSSLSDAPLKAITLTIPAIMRAKVISCVVPDQRKSAAIRDALNGNVSCKCPASILTEHQDCILWLDEDSASLVPSDFKFLPIC